MRTDHHTRTVEVHDRSGDLVGTKEVVLYAGLLTQAHDDGLVRIQTAILQVPTEDNGRLAILKVEVETAKGHFEAIGDASPESVDEHLAPHLIRVAETRAKARALRDAVNVGISSIEELDGVRHSRDLRPGSGATPPRSSLPPRNGTPAARPRTNGHAQPPRPSNGLSEPMSEGQRRYLFRIMAGQGYQREAAEERLKDLFEVSSLSQVTKVAAVKMLDQLLASAPATGGGGNGAATHPQR